MTPREKIREAVAKAKNSTKLPDRADSASEIELVSLSTIKARPVKWAVPGRVPRGCVTLIAAYGGLGKSTMTRSYIAAVTTGRPAFGLTYDPGPAGNVLMIAAEDDYETAVIPHLLAEGADLSRIAQPFYLQIEKGNRRTRAHLRPDHIADLRDYLRSAPTMPHTLVIDPVASFSGRAGINDAKATEVRSVIDPLSDLAIETGMAVIVIAHLNKGSANGPAANRIAGSRAYVDAVRLAYIIGEHPDDPDARVLAPAKANIVGINRQSAVFRLEPLANVETNDLRQHPAVADLSNEDFAELSTNLSRVVFAEDDTVSANDLAGDAKPKAEGKKLDRCIEWLREHLKELAYPSVEIERAGTQQGFGICTIRAAKKRLKDEGLVNEKDGLEKWWSGMGPSAFWKRRPDPAEVPVVEDASSSRSSSCSSPSSPSSPSASSSLFSLSEDDEEDKGNEGDEHDEGNGGKSRSVAEHLENEKARTSAPPPPKTGRRYGAVNGPGMAKGGPAL